MPITDPEARAAYQRQWNADRRMVWITEHGPCAHCGSWDEPEVDHIDPNTKAMNPRVLWSLSPTNPKRIAELAKCQVLCHPCHLEKTSVERERPVPHGTDTGYTANGCRCPSCTEAHRVVKQAWRDARKAAGLPYS